MSCGHPEHGLVGALGQTVCALPPLEQLTFVTTYLAQIVEGGFTQLTRTAFSPEGQERWAAVVSALDAAAAACRDLEASAASAMVDTAVARILADG